MVEVQVRIQKVLHALSCNLPASARAAVCRHAQLALERATQALTLQADKQALLQLHQRLFG